MSCLEVRYTRRLCHAKALALRVMLDLLVVARARYVEVRIVQAADVSCRIRRDLFECQVYFLLVVDQVVAEIVYLEVYLVNNCSHHILLILFQDVLVLLLLGASHGRRLLSTSGYLAFRPITLQGSELTLFLQL